MELFSIHCTTCRARLKVRELSAIGQILACPKCESMVQVEPPPGWVQPPPAAIPVFDSPPPIAAAPSAAAPSAAAPSAAAPNAAQGNAAASKSATSHNVLPAAANAAKPSQARAPGTSGLQSGAKPLPRAAEAPAATGNVSPTEKNAGGSTIGRAGPKDSEARRAQSRVTQAVAIPAGLASRKAPVAGSPDKPRSSENSQKILAAAVPLAAALASLPTPAAAAIPPDQAVPRTPDSRWMMPLLVGGVALAFVAGIGLTYAIFHRPSPVASAVAGTSTVVARPAVEPGNLPAGIENPPATGIENPPATGIENPPVASTDAAAKPTVDDRKPALVADAGVLPPAPAVAPATDPVKPPAVIAPAVGAAPVGVPAVAEVAPENRVDDPFRPADPLAAPRINAPQPPVEKPGVAGTVKLEVKRTPPRKVDVEARLEDSLPEIEFRSLSLDRFASTIAQLTTANVTLDAQSLEELGITPATAVSVSVRDATIGKTLQTALAPLGLGYVIRDGQLVIQRPTDAPRNVRYSVADLVADDPQSKVEFVSLLTRSVAPESWKAAGGSGDLKWFGQQLAIDQSPAVHYQLLVFCEKLRVARGMAPRSKVDPARFKMLSHHARVAAALQQTVTANFVAPRPLAEIIDYLQTNGHVNILVDWQSLSKEELAPETTLSLRIGTTTVEEALTTLASALDLAVVCVDDKTVQLTTRKAATRLQVEFYPLATIITDELTGDLLAKRASDRVAALRDPQAGLRGVVLYDPAGKCLIVAQPQATQIEIEKAVDGWRQRKLEVSRR